MTEAIVKNLKKSFGSTQAVRGVSFTVKSQKFVTLLGLSGCGKTTVLRCIAGIEEPDEGEISIGGEVVFSSANKIFVPPERRGIGMVFQSYAIWPHLTVFENIAYPLKIRKMPREEISKKVKEVLELVHLSGLEDRLAPNLSGGQQQRVALARSLVYNPKLLLFDEPLSNLDAPLREEMRGELKLLQKSIGITAIYVTHDRTEALSLSDELVIMGNGRVLATGTPYELLDNPPNSYTAVLLAGMSVIYGRVAEATNGSVVFDAPFGRVYCKSGDAKEGENMKLCLRVDQLNLLKAPNNKANVFAATIIAVTHSGYLVEYKMMLNGQAIKVVREREKAPTTSVGDKVYLEIPEKACALVRD